MWNVQIKTLSEVLMPWFSTNSCSSSHKLQMFCRRFASVHTRARVSLRSLTCVCVFRYQRQVTSSEFLLSGHVVSAPHLKHFSSTSSPLISDFPLKEFHQLADSELELMMDSLGEIEDTLDDVDISFSVTATITKFCGCHGIHVYSTQSP